MGRTRGLQEAGSPLRVAAGDRHVEDDHDVPARLAEEPLGIVARPPVGPAVLPPDLVHHTKRLVDIRMGHGDRVAVVALARGMIGQSERGRHHADGNKGVAHGSVSARDRETVSPAQAPAAALPPSSISIIDQQANIHNAAGSGRPATTIDDLAAAERINPSYVSRILRLTLLAPAIIEAILAGTLNQGVILKRLEKAVPADWGEQRAT